MRHRPHRRIFSEAASSEASSSLEESAYRRNATVVNIDAKLVRSMVRQVEEKPVEMSNCCICCTLREDLLQEVAALAKEKRFDYLLIESTGISEPMQVTETFIFDPELPPGEEAIAGTSPLSNLVRLDTMVSVVDSKKIWENWQSSESLRDCGEQADDEDERTIIDLLRDQVEFANVILLNKKDLVEEERLAEIEAVLKTLNPKATIIRTEKSIVDPARVLGTGLFDFEEAKAMSGWLEEERGTYKPESIEFCVGGLSFAPVVPSIRVACTTSCSAAVMILLRRPLQVFPLACNTQRAVRRVGRSRRAGRNHARRRRA